MTFGLKRSDLQTLSITKLDDAHILFQNKRYSSAYYLAGYCIELGLKACISRLMLADVIPDKAFVNQIYQHSLRPLVNLAGLASVLKAKEDGDATFAANWAIVLEWTPETRYYTKDIHSAQLLLNAISDPKTGVLVWIKEHW
jgi:hypothetical protein